MSQKKPHAEWQASVAKAVKLVETGWSIRGAAKKTGLPKSTVADHCGKFKGFDTRKGPERCLSETEETGLVNYALYMAEHGFPLTRKVIKSLCIDIIKKSGRTTLVNLEKGPSDKWVKKFLNRHQELSERVPHVIDRARASVSEQQLTQYFELLQNTVTSLGLDSKGDQIWNCDETGFSGREKSYSKVIGHRGLRQPWRVHVSFSGHVTVQLAISANGRTMPPMLIYDKNLPRSNFRDGLPDTWLIEYTKTGYINSDLFLKWFVECFVANCGNHRPVLLTLDNHVSHLSAGVIDAARANNIHLLCFPAHSTHLLQPLDVGYFHDLKSKVGNLCVSLGFTGMSTLPRHKFPMILKLALDKIPPNTPVSAFRVAGLFPVNKEAVAAIPGPSKCHSEPVSVSQQTSDQPDVCNDCGHVTENPLVRLGVIPPELASILVEPPAITKPNSKRPRCEKARVITDPEPADDHETEDFVVTDILPMEEPEDFSQTSCVLCGSGTNKWKWIGCDRCEDYWVHYDCLTYEDRVDVDLSLIVGEPWFCGVCKEE